MINGVNALCRDSDIAPTEESVMGAPTKAGSLRLAEPMTERERILNLVFGDALEWLFEKAYAFLEHYPYAEIADWEEEEGWSTQQHRFEASYRCLLDVLGRFYRLAARVPRYADILKSGTPMSHVDAIYLLMKNTAMYLRLYSSQNIVYRNRFISDASDTLEEPQEELAKVIVAKNQLEKFLTENNLTDKNSNCSDLPGEPSKSLWVPPMGTRPSLWTPPPIRAWLMDDYAGV